VQAQFERDAGGAIPADRQAISDQMQREILAVRQSAKILGIMQGDGLMIQTAPNTFRLIFPVVMRVVPHLIVTRTPNGTDAMVIESSRVGTTIIYSPMTNPVLLSDIRSGDFAFSAEL
jgi:hypothetical protein